MARVALVTGGSRGIGAAISVALKAAGYKVAANYAGNDEAAAAFTKETGIPPTNGRLPITTPAWQASPRLKPKLARSMCW
jgi:NAD(P)-dependent dehydrogenase (short-subunit alcohol dehydrogenase family)